MGLRMMGIVTGYRLFVMSYSGLQTKFWRSLLTQHVYLATPEQRQGKGSSKTF